MKTLALVTFLALPLAAGPHPAPGARLAHAAARLGLDDAQKEALRQAVASEKEALLAVAGAEESARLALDAAVTAVPYDPARVAAAFAPVAAADADLAALRARLYSKCLGVLTPEQAARANVLLAHGTQRAGAAIEAFLARAAANPAALPRFARLGLSEAQKEELNALFARHADEIRAVLASEKESRAALRAAIRRSVADEAGARAAQGAVSAADARGAQLRARIHAEAAAILTREQAERAERRHGALRDFVVARVDAALRLVDALL